MWYGHLYHRANRCKTATNILGRFIYVCSIRTINSTNVHARLLNCICQPLHHVQVRVKFNLSWTVKKNKTIIRELLQFCQKPIYIIYQVLHTVDEAAIGTPVLHFLNIVKRDQISDIDVTLIFENFGCWVEITNFYCAALLLGDLLNCMTKSRFARTSWTHYHTTKSTCHLYN